MLWLSLPLLFALFLLLPSPFALEGEVLELVAGGGTIGIAFDARGCVCTKPLERGIGLMEP